eukprot:764582-Hanusia_phi.AAC.2
MACDRSELTENGSMMVSSARTDSEFLLPCVLVSLDLVTQCRAFKSSAWEIGQVANDQYMHTTMFPTHLINKQGTARCRSDSDW